VAVSDPEGILASPVGTIERQDGQKDIADIIALASQKGAEKIIVGLPRSLNGTTGIQAEKVQTFVRELKKHTKLPVEFRDERLSTVSALRMTEGSKKRRDKGSVDAMAAAVILQTYLEETRDSSDTAHT
jgi:putative Holliday junction resolvase